MRFYRLSGFRWVCYPIVSLLLLLCLPIEAAIDKKQVEARIKQLEQESVLSESRKTELSNQLEAIVAGLQQVTEFEQQAAEYRESVNRLPKLIRELEAETKRLERNPPIRLTVPADEPIEEIEQRLIRIVSQQTTLESELSMLQEQLVTEQNRPQQIRRQLWSLPRFDLPARASHGAMASGLQQNLDTIIKQWQSELEIRLVKSEKLVLEAELVRHPVLLDLIDARINLKQRILELTNHQIEDLENALANRRARDAEEFRDRAAQAEQNVANQQPVVIDLAARNLALSSELRNIVQELAQVKKHEQNLNETVQRLRDDFSATRKKIEVAGLSQAMGQILLEDRRRIAAISLTDWLNLTSERQLAEVGLKRIQYEEERRSLRNIADTIARMTKDLPHAAELHDELQFLLESRRNILDRVIESEQKRLRALSNLDYSLRQLVTLIEDYRDYISERLLWVKSARAIDFNLLAGTPEQFTRLLSLTRLQTLANAFQQLVVDNFLAVGFGVISLLVFVLKRRTLMSALANSAQPLKRLTTDSFQFTLQALLLSIVLASPLPVVMMLFALSIQSTVGGSHLITEIGVVLPPVALFLFFVQLVRQLCRENGLLRVHFKWTESNVDQIKLAMDKLLYLLIPAILFSLILIGYDFGSLTGALPHLASLFTMVLLGYCLLSTLLKQKQIQAAQADPQSPTQSSANTLGYLLLVAPLLFGLAGLSGYLYSVSMLFLQLMHTFEFTIVLALIHQLVIRWLTLASRKLAYKNALERRAAARQKAQESSTEAAGSDPWLDVEEPKIDLDAVSKGAKKLLNTGLSVAGAIGFWLIWADILPAFSILDEFTLWHYTGVENGREINHAVSLFDLGLAVFIVAITLIAAKRLPALLEFILLPYMKNSRGGLYTTRTLLQYLIVAIGLLVVLNRIGVSWTQLQWLAAALSVGIGFGLQEIVANFVSGLIILFERPIRVGDVVTVGDTDGVVTRIKIRATTIRNWDHKELLVPNKEFITSRLLNWTLSDQTTRLMITIGVAYGSDVEQAMAIVTRLAKAHSQVLSEPVPTVYFENLGDNALIINLHAYVGKSEYRLSTLSELHVAIYNALNDAQIPISYPQRDVHLDTSQPLDIRLSSAN